MNYFVETRRTVERSGPLAYTPLTELAGVTGFRSVFAVDAPLRDLILRKGSVGGLENAPVYSDTLFVDFDTDSGVEAAVQRLVDTGCHFEVWNTGRRGVHLHVPITPMRGAGVPHSQLTWVRANFEGDWDETVYRHHSIIRLPGTFHEKNPGHCKQLMVAYAGVLLTIPLLERPPPVSMPHTARGDRNPSEFWSSVLSPHQSPGRTFRIFHLGALAAECGLPFDEGLAAARSWAQTIANPPLHNEQEIRRVFVNGYEKGGVE